MTKYTRSRQKLLECIKDIFAVSVISLDTKLIVLFLAGTLPSIRFQRWIDAIPQLEPVNGTFKQINTIRHTLGKPCRDYIILTTLQAAKRDIDSEELQDFISQPFH